MSKNTRNFSKSDDEDKRETIRKLKAQVKKLLKDNKLLRTQNKTLNQVWDKTKDYLEELHEDTPLEKVLEHKKYPKKPDELPDKKKAIDELEEARARWKNWNKEKK